MRKTIVSLFMMFPLIATTAQESKWSLTPQVGLNLTDIGGKDAPDIYKMALGPTAGLEAEWRMGKLIGVSLGAFYSNQGSKTEETRLDEWIMNETSEPYYREYTHRKRLSMHYIAVPVMLNFHVMQGLTLKTGIQLSDLFAARKKGDFTSVFSRTNNPYVKITSDIWGDIDTRHQTYAIGHPLPPISAEDIVDPVWNENSFSTGFRYQCKRYDIAIPIAVSYEYKNIVLGIKYQHGLMAINKPDRGGYDYTNSDKGFYKTSKTDKYYNRNISITLGYRIGK